MLACNFLFSYNPFPFCELGSHVPMFILNFVIWVFSLFILVFLIMPLARECLWPSSSPGICGSFSKLLFVKTSHSSAFLPKHLVCPLFALTVIPFQITEATLPHLCLNIFCQMPSSNLYYIFITSTLSGESSEWPGNKDTLFLSFREPPAGLKWQFFENKVCSTPSGPRAHTGAQAALFRNVTESQKEMEPRLVKMPQSSPTEIQSSLYD